MSLLNFISKADFVEWLCPVAESPASPTLSQPLLQEFVDVFPLKLPTHGLPVNRVTEPWIVLFVDSQPTTHRLHSTSPDEDKKLKAQLAQSLADDYIEPARSAYGAGTLFARKKYGGLRLCIDYRAFKNISQADKFHLTRCLTKYTFNKVFIRFGFTTNVWIERHFRRDLDLTNLR